MTRDQFHVGQKVIFGRGRGEQTLGEIVKLNPTKAKVKTLESRGNGRGAVVGAVWTVPYSLMRDAGVSMIDTLNSMPPVNLGLNPADAPVSVYGHGDECIMEAIIDTYNRLSPEWLTCDGELSRTQVISKRNSLNAKLNHLFRALGRPVSESAAHKWAENRKLDIPG